MEEAIREVPASQVEIDPDQPRRGFGDLEGLKLSIRHNGILQPPVVTQLAPDRYRVLAGGRRVRAAQELGLPTIQVIIRSVDEHQRRYLQLVENLQREDLDPFEQADTFRQLMEQHGISEEALGERFGKSQDYVSKMLTIGSGIPEEIRQEYYATSRKVSPSILLEIPRAESESVKWAMWEHARDGHYTVKQARVERSEERSRGEERSTPDALRQSIRLDQGTVVVRCNSAATMEQILEMLREAAKYWEQRMALSRLRAIEERSALRPGKRSRSQ
jgi:ParB family transcriptional regulator, chromosome partitioning protein